MSPPSATLSASEGQEGEIGSIATEVTYVKSVAAVEMPKFEGYVRFDDPYEQRQYLKTRLALAFRIFAKLGFDDGVSGHITLRVSPFGAYLSLTI